MKRKSPIKHKVHSYKKDSGTSVDSYVRGSGSNPSKKLANPKIKTKLKIPKTSKTIMDIAYAQDKEEFEKAVKELQDSQNIPELWELRELYLNIEKSTATPKPPAWTREILEKYNVIPGLTKTKEYTIIYLDKKYRKHTEQMTKREVDEFYQRVRKNGLTVVSVQKQKQPEPETLGTEEETHDAYSRRRRGYFRRKK